MCISSRVDAPTDISSISRVPSMTPPTQRVWIFSGGHTVTAWVHVLSSPRMTSRIRTFPFLDRFLTEVIPLQKYGSLFESPKNSHILSLGASILILTLILTTAKCGAFSINLDKYTLQHINGFGPGIGPGLITYQLFVSEI